MNTLIKHFITLFYRNVLKAFKRFPVTFLFSVAFTLLALFDLFNFHYDFFSDHDERRAFGESLDRAQLFTVCMVLITFSLTLFREMHQTSRAVIAGVGTAIAAIIGTTFFTADHLELPALFIISASIAGLFCAPYFLKPVEDNHCCQHNSTLAANIVFAMLSTLVFSGGLSVILASLEYLFEVDFPHRIYPAIWILGTGFFAPIYMLANTPTHEEQPTEELTYPKGIQFIVRYLLSPLLLVYTAILYAYAAKILFQMELPKGNLTYMVSSYALIGMLTYITAYPLMNAGIAIAGLIRKHFFKLILLPIVLIFIAIGVRITEYGVTWERYAVTAFALWLAGSTLYMIFSQKKSFNLILSAAVVILFLASFGPWGARSVSVSSQTERFEAFLKEYKLVDSEGNIIPATLENKFTNKQVKDLRSTLQYLAKHDADGAWNHPFDQQTAKTENDKYGYRSHYTATSNYMTQLGLDGSDIYYHYSGKDGDDTFYRNVSIYRHGPSTHFITVKGFDYQGHISQYRGYNEKNPYPEKGTTLYLNDNLTIEKVMTKTGITFRQDKKILGEINLTKAYEKLKAKGLSGQVTKENHGLLNIDSINNASGWRFRFVIDNMALRETDKKLRMQSYNGKLLVKVPQ